jgi:putative resolvase
MYRIGEFAQRMGRCPSTVRRWKSKGRIVARRTASGQRYFIDTDVRRVLQPSFEESARKTVMYCQVSSPGQKDDLASQMEAMELLAIVHTFSGRLHGLRRCEKTLKDELAGGSR